jgi:hypothetical protein
VTVALGEVTAHHHVVVYQLGKVASTSIVNSLNKVEGVIADQSHFLGADSLRQIVDMLIDIRRPEYFYEHNLGQFLRNLKLTRAVYEFRAGLREGERLVIISLCRDPLQWLRSSVAQDIKGYLSFFQEVATDRGLSCADEDDMVAQVLPIVLQTITDALIRVGGVDALLAGGKQWHRALPNTENRGLDHHFRSFLSMAMRPFDWYEAHFEKLLDIKLDSLAPIAQNLLYRDIGWSDVYVLRYEDIPVSMPIVAERLGIADRFVLSSDNVSADKDFADAIRKSFRSREAEHLGEVFRESRYSRLFGY